MKKILSLVFICLSINVLAQNNTSPFPVSGNVGIGTTNPLHALHITRPTNSVSSIGLEQNGINMWRFGMAANSPDLRFSPNSDVLNNSILTIQQGGNVGVGTLNPLTKLYVDGDIGIPSLKKIKVGYYLNIQEHIKQENEYDRALIAQGLAWDNDNNRYDLTSNSPYNRNGIILGNAGIKFFAHEGNITGNPTWSQAELNNKVHLFVGNTGQIGVGTISPQYKFHVFGGSIKAVNYDNNSGISIGAAATERPQIGFHVSDNSRRFKIEVNSVNQANERIGIFSIHGGAWPETEVFSVIKNGNVGISTVNPQSQLEIKTLGGAADGQGLRLTNIVSNRSWELKSGSPSVNNDFFTIKDILANSVRFTIKDDGNVGIGASNPSAKLEVYNNTAAGSTELLNKWSFDPNYWWLGLEQQHFGGSHVQWNFKQKNYNSEVDLLSFKLGNVGIGTTNPAAKLEVNGNTLIKVAGIPELTIEGTGNSNYAGGALQLKSGTLQANDKYNQTTIIMDRGTTGTGMLSIQRRFDNSYYGQLLDYSDLNGWRFLTASERTATTTNERFSIKSNGQITIGTTTPYSDYKLSIAGNVIADKVKVKKSANGVWPDFVFSPTYKLPNLTEVENFVKQNSHLPEIPSAKEIEKEGQDLGEMNRLLLKKVEELTLYLIEIEKKNKEQDILIQKLLNK